MRTADGSAAAAGGKTALVGVQMAVDRINKSGGLNGRPVEVSGLAAYTLGFFFFWALGSACSAPRNVWPCSRQTSGQVGGLCARAGDQRRGGR